MSSPPPESQPRRSARSARRSLAWEATWEYASGSLWVLPTLAAVVALAIGFAMSLIQLAPGSPWQRLAFQGTADDARTLLITVTSTVVTVIALVLGLTVVALQLSSTQFSPRLLRNFLRDRGTQVVLSVFLATFVYSAAGLFTVGFAQQNREDFPRLAISGSILLLFASLAMVVYFADHLAHGIQIDAINRRIETNTRRVIQRMSHRTDTRSPHAPDWAVDLPARRSGYLQVVHPELLLPVAVDAGVTICLRAQVGQHVIAGTVLGWAWTPRPEDPQPDAERLAAALDADTRIGFERTIEQDIAFGIRQQIDIACKALSPAVNDPYTAVQALDHLTVLCCDIAVRPLGALILTGPDERGRVIVPDNDFADYVFFVLNTLGRYGANEYLLMSALLRMLRSCYEVLPAGSDRLPVLDRGVQRVVGDAEREMQRPSDLEQLRRRASHLREQIGAKQAVAG